MNACRDDVPHRVKQFELLAAGFRAPLLLLSPEKVQGEGYGDKKAKYNPGGHSLALLCEYWPLSMMQL
jgi:hypothetical protein